MMTSTMKDKALRVARSVVPLAFWLLIWQALALIVNHSYFLPSVPETFRALIELVSTSRFFLVVAMTLLRVLAGLLIGVASGALLAFLSYKLDIFRAFIAPLMTVIKSTPVATIIIILWIAMSGDALAIFIAVMMVTPIVWQNVLDGFSSISKELLELCDMYEFSFGARVRYLMLPVLVKYFFPAVITSIGLAWKSEIAAEIIAYTKNSIGYYINDAKNFYLSDTVFAWTVVIIVMSILLEKITKILISRCKL